MLALGALPCFAETQTTPVKFEEVDAGMPYNVAEIPVSNPASMQGLRIAVLAAHGFEEIELTYPLRHFERRGAQVDIISPDWIQGRVMAVQFLKPSVWLPVTKNISQAKVEDYDAVVVPGGAWNPIIMRTDGKVLDFLRAASSKGLLIASVCHGPQVLLSAGLVKGKMVTGVGDIRIDLRNAGASVIEDQPVVVTGNLLTSRDPNDIGQFSQGIEDALQGARRTARFERLHSGRLVTCPGCSGSGRTFGGPGNYSYACPTCKGTGQVATELPPVSTDH
jgi:protease I